MQTLPALTRPGALIAAGIAAWPVMAVSVASAAGVGGCVRSHGVAGFIATHGAMMRAIPSCPSTSVGLPGAIDSAMAVIVAAAVLTSVIHVLLAAVGTRAIELLHRAAEAIGRMIAPVLIHVKNQPNLRLPSVSSAHHFRQNFSVGMPWRRGPPSWGIAAL